MKPELPQVSRRRFLVASAGGAAATLPARYAHGTARPGDASEPHQATARKIVRRPPPGAAPEVVRAVALAIDNVLLEGLEDIFPRPFELEYLTVQPQLRCTLADLVSARILRTDYEGMKPVHVVQVPKRNQRGFRSITVIDPADYVTYLALCILVAEDVEAKRVALPERCVYACRYAPRDGRLFRNEFNFGGFRRAVRRHLGRSGGQFFVTADIANFFASVRVSLLAARLETLGAKGWVVDAIAALLTRWEADGVTGLPVGSNASRILSEALLVPIDTHLRGEGIDYLRFMDDFRLFAPDLPTANRWVETLSRRLTEDGLALSDVKTTIQEVPVSIDAARLGQKKSNLQITANAYLLDREKEAAEASARGIRSAQMDGSDDTEIIYKFNNTFRYFPYRERGQRFARGVDLPELVAKLEKWRHLSGSKMKTFVNACFYQQDFAALARLPDYLTKAPKAAWYCVDFLIQERARLPTGFKHSIAARLATQLLDAGGMANHQALAVLQLLAVADYARPREVMRYIAELPEDACPYLHRLALDALHTARRDRIAAGLSLVEVFEAAAPESPWCTRALLRLALTDDAAAGHVDRLAQSLAGDPFAAALYAQCTWVPETV